MEIWSVVYTRYDKDGNELYIDTHVSAQRSKPRKHLMQRKKEHRSAMRVGGMMKTKATLIQ